MSTRFDTQEESDLALEKIATEDEAEFHAEIIKYVTGEPNDLGPGAVGKIMANIAKKLIAKNPSLISLEKKAELMEAINEIYLAEHVNVLKVLDLDFAATEIAITHEDDLPQA